MSGSEVSLRVSLSIAHFRIQVHNSHPRLAEALQARYAKFLLPSSENSPITQDLKLELRKPAAGETAQPRHLALSTQFRQGTLHFLNDEYQGWVTGKEGCLCLSSAYPVEDVDYFIRAALALFAYEHGCLLVHTAGIVHNGQAYLFFGHSGSGKTTVCRNARGGLVLNDDLLLLVPQAGVWLAYSTPFWNPSQVIPQAACAPVAGVYRLVQDRQVYAERMGSTQALAELVSNIPVIPDDPARLPGLLSRLQGLLTGIPVYSLHFLPDDSFWEAVF